MAPIFAAFQYDGSLIASSAGPEVAMVVRYVREDETYIAQEREALARQRARGQATAEAERRLAAFESAQRVHKAHLRRLVARIEEERWGGGRH